MQEKAKIVKETEACNSTVLLE